jgi:4,5-dihydroxyphthalate decarboxylase
MELTGGDPLPYGVEPNRAVLEELMRHAVTQRILERPLPLDEVFLPLTENAAAGS